MRPLATLLATVALVVVSRRANADEPLRPPRDDDETRARLAAVAPPLVLGAREARRWYWGWTGLFAGASAVSFASLLVFDDRGLRADAVVGGSLSALGAVTTLALPLTAGRADGELASMPEGTPEERTRKLRRAEELLVKAAAEERFLSSWAAHAGVFGANLAAGAVSRWVYDRPWSMIALGRGVGTLVGEIKVVTTPVTARDSLPPYLRSLAVVPTLGGVAVVGAF